MTALLTLTETEVRAAIKYYLKAQGFDATSVEFSGSKDDRTGAFYLTTEASYNVKPLDLKVADSPEVKDSRGAIPIPQESEG